MSEEAKIDGRKARGRRTHDAIVTSLLALIEEGQLAPTAGQIAERAGVSVRSVYQHFTDVEGLYADASARVFDRVRSISGEMDPAWPLARRIEDLSASRATALEMLAPFSRASRLLEPSSPTIRENRFAIRRWVRERLARIFAPELAKAPGPERGTLLDALDVVISADAWEHLRSGGCSVEDARRVVQLGLTALLTGSSSPTGS